MASKFWVGGTGTWDATTTTHWSLTSGGAAGAAVPGATDTPTFDANSGGGVVTMDATLAGATFAGLVGGAFTGTLDNSVNNVSFTLNGELNWNGSGTNTLNLGSGTITINATSTTNIDFTGANHTINHNNGSIVCSCAASGSRGFLLGTKTLNNLTIANTNAAGGGYWVDFANSGAFTIAGTLTFQNLSAVRLPQATLTIANLATSGLSASNSMTLFGNGTTCTISLGNASTISWVALQNVNVTGVGAPLIANNGFSAGNVSGVTVNSPGGTSGGSVFGS